ncbi:hypothetical protein HDU93_004802 [Gonapodya sp. JEL0774]|nr:hypothetical protein HDU93_004802 [Gonapodya sp. JEL0774]
MAQKVEYQVHSMDYVQSTHHEPTTVATMATAKRSHPALLLCHIRSHMGLVFEETAYRVENLMESLGALVKLLDSDPLQRKAYKTDVQANLDVSVVHCSFTYLTGQSTAEALLMHSSTTFPKLLRCIKQVDSLVESVQELRQRMLNTSPHGNILGKLDMAVKRERSSGVAEESASQEPVESAANHDEETPATDKPGQPAAQKEDEDWGPFLVRGPEGKLHVRNEAARPTVKLEDKDLLGPDSNDVSTMTSFKLSVKTTPY